MFFLFSSLFLKSFLTIGCRPCGKAGASVHLEKNRFRSERVSNLAFSAFCEHGKKRRNKVKQEEGKHANNIIKTTCGTKTKKHHIWSQNGAQNRSQYPLFRSWRPVSRKIDPKTRQREPPGDKKRTWDAPKDAPSEFPSNVLPLLKPNHHHHHPPRVLPLHFAPFFLKIAAGASAGCKNRGVQGLMGHSWGWGEKLKLLQQQASLLFKASLREA